MVGVAQWAVVRRMHRVERLSIREISRWTGLHRRTIGRSGARSRLGIAGRRRGQSWIRSEAGSVSSCRLIRGSRRSGCGRWRSSLSTAYSQEVQCSAKTSLRRVLKATAVRAIPTPRPMSAPIGPPTKPPRRAPPAPRPRAAIRPTALSLSSSTSIFARRRSFRSASRSRLRRSRESFATSSRSVAGAVESPDR